MRIDILTLFPAMFQGPLTESILRRAQDDNILEIRIHDIRAFTEGKHKQVDDSPYGGGAGMVMMAEPIVKAMETIMNCEGRIAKGEKYRHSHVATRNSPHRIYLSPRGKRLTQGKVENLTKRHEWILLLCGHYEGTDQRVIDAWIDEEISIGDYVLTGGELPAMVLIDALARQLPGVLGKNESSAEESFSKKLGRKKEYPHYTRPEEFRGMRVPEVLLSGNHAKIEEWRRSQLR
ncbi:tRNA (guanosine(37)-N1)-methyltransferase TrmD [Candidatus Peregrinibacteria bacterium]|nr:tRNA (guanosine(37)-N1)-methyltransferase TrmD [Candidatus Peregrinibacteria bacterium]